MQQKILSIHYSQSGQLDQIVANFLKPFEGQDIDEIIIQPKQAFPFPWTTDNFFDQMPDTVLQNPIELEEITFKHEKYDLIIFGYQPWFLSPSLPTTGILNHPDFLSKLKNTPVVTLIGARNMWINAQESVKISIHKAGGELIANIPLIDKHNNSLSAVSILHWMLTGKKTRKWGIFPLPGISDSDINSAEKAGEIVKLHTQNKTTNTLQNSLIQSNFVRVYTNILFIESRAKLLFRLWAKLIQRKTAEGKNRKFWVSFFKYYLLIALFIVAPIVLTFYTILIRPFQMNAIKRKKAYFCSVKHTNQ